MRHIIITTVIIIAMIILIMIIIIIIKVWPLEEAKVQFVWLNHVGKEEQKELLRIYWLVLPVCP